jgi:flagellar hook-associated protein 3 FlgL
MTLWSPKGYTFELSAGVASDLVDLGFPVGNNSAAVSVAFEPSVTGTVSLVSANLATIAAGDTLTITPNGGTPITVTFDALFTANPTAQQVVDYINTAASGTDILASLNSKRQLVIQSKDGTTFTVTGTGSVPAALGITNGTRSSASVQGPFNQLTTTRTGNNVKKIDFFGVMDQLISAVEGGDVDGISDIMLTKLDNWLNTLLKNRAQVGALTNRYSTTESRYVSNNTNYTELHDQTVGVDLAEVITQYEMAASIYEASLASIARIMQVTLLDFLR